jgi:hypothetical protein
LDATHPALRGFTWPAAIHQWIVVLHDCIETERALDGRIPQTLFLVPILTKKTFQGPEALAKADKLQSAKWKALTLPLEVLQQEVSPPAPSEPQKEPTTTRPSRTSKPKKATSKRRATSPKTKSTKPGSSRGRTKGTRRKSR